MKILNTEKGEIVLYIQKKDIGFIDTTEAEVIPNSYKSLGINGILIDENHQNEFVRIDDPSQIDYFMSLEYIMDVNAYRNLSNDELALKIDALIAQYNELESRYNKEIDQTLINHGTMVLKRLRYLIETMQKYLYYMSGQEFIPFPHVSLSNGFGFKELPGFAYTISESIDPRKILLSKNNGAVITDSYIMNNSAFILWLFEYIKSRPDFEDCNISYSFSSDNKYLITTLTPRKTNVLKDKAITLDPIQ